MRSAVTLSIAAVIILACFSNAPAQDYNEAKTIGLQTAIDNALKNNAEYRISLKEQKLAKEKVNEVWSDLFPSIESEASLARQHFDQGINSLSDGMYDIKIVQIKFGINPGAFYNSLQLSRKGYNVSTEKVREIRNNVTYNVVKSYFDVILSQEVIDLQKSAIKFLKENLKDVENQYKTGTVPKYDLLQARVKLQSQEPELIDAENNYKLALDYFNFVMGEDDVYFNPDKSEMKIPVNPVTTVNHDDRIKGLTDEAMKNRPEIMMIKLKKETSEDKQDIYQSMYLWPIFTVGGYYGYNKNLVAEDVSPLMSSVIGDNDWQANWQIRIAATYRWGSLFPIDANKVKAREAEIEMKKAELELNQLKRGISISVKSSYYGVTSSYDKILAHKKSVETAEEGLRIARESYKAGVIKNSDLLAAQFELTKVMTGYIKSLNEYYLSLARLQKETGSNEPQAFIIKGE